MSKSKYIKSQFPHKIGNKKIGLDTIVFNIDTAHNCRSFKKGYCQLKERTHCYAYRDELRYKNTLKYRLKQKKAFNELSAKQIASELFKTILKYDIKYIRFNESGDISTQKELAKLKKIARYLSFVTFYGFSANKDLNFNRLPKNLIINGSGFMINNKFSIIDKKDNTNYQYLCKSDCTICDYCKSKKGLDIKVKKH